MMNRHFLERYSSYLNVESDILLFNNRILISDKSYRNNNVVEIMSDQILIHITQNYRLHENAQKEYYTGKISSKYKKMEIIILRNKIFKLTRLVYKEFSSKSWKSIRVVLLLSQQLPSRSKVPDKNFSPSLLLDDS